MTDLNQTILQKASGSHRLKPDEQNLYLGTYGERVLLTLNLADAGQSLVKAKFPDLLAQISASHSPILVKLSAKLDTGSQLFYMKQAQDLKLSYTLVDDGQGKSPFGLVLHTDQAVNLDKTDLFEQYPDWKETSKEVEPTTTKKSFFQKLFGL